MLHAKAIFQDRAVILLAAKLDSEDVGVRECGCSDELGLLG